MGRSFNDRPKPKPSKKILNSIYPTAAEVLPRREGSAYIEGGGRYQQRTDTYNDLIEELLWEEKPV